MYLVSEFQLLVSPLMLYRMHGMYGGLPSWRNPAKHPTSPHGSMAAGDCSDAAVQGLCAGRGMVEARGRSCWGTAGPHRSKQPSCMFVFAATPGSWSQGDETSGMRMFANGGLQENWMYREHRGISRPGYHSGWDDIFATNSEISCTGGSS